MPRDDRLYLIDIIEAIDALDRFLSTRIIDHLVEDEILSAAVLQKFIVIGEASARISKELKYRYNNVSWHRIIALRNVAVHAYFAIDWQIVWNAATVNVPSLRPQIANILATEYPDEFV